MTGNEGLQDPGASNSSALPTTKVLFREASTMNRTEEVKLRLGPIMERVKSSLARIQALEHSIARGMVDEKSKGDAIERTIFVSGLGEVESRHFLKRSMGILRKKISRLQQMEESLGTSEDRREHLQHYILQVSLSRPMMELASTKRRNRDLELQLSSMERDFRNSQGQGAEQNIVKECDAKRSKNVEESTNFESRRDSIVSNKGGFEQKLKSSTSGDSALSRHSKVVLCEAEEINAIGKSKELLNGERKGNLHVAVDILKSTEDQGSYTKSSGSVQSNWTAVTDPDTDTSTVHSGSDTGTCSESQDVNVSLSACHSQSNDYEEYPSNPLDSSIDSSDAGEYRLDSLHEFEAELMDQEVDESIHLLSVSHEGQGAALIVKLMARIKQLEQDNRELKELVSMQGNHTREYYTISPCSTVDRKNGQ